MRRLSALLNISSSELEQKGVFDPYIDLDAPLFVHPKLLSQSEIPEFKEVHQTLIDYFTKIIGQLEQAESASEIDRHYREAKRNFDFPETEVRFMALGLSSDSIKGRGLTGKSAIFALKTIYKAVKIGYFPPAMFEMLPVYQPHIGSDRLSDMINSIILQHVMAYTERILEPYRGDATVAFKTKTYKGKKYTIPFIKASHDDRERPVYVLPRNILADIPTPLTYQEIEEAIRQNREVRESFVVGYLSKSFQRAIKDKRKMQEEIIENPILRTIINESAQNKKYHPYDFGKDPKGVERPINKILALLEKHYEPKQPKTPELTKQVLHLIESFKDLIEKHGLSQELYVDGKRHKEDVLHKMFWTYLDVVHQKEGETQWSHKRVRKGTSYNFVFQKEDETVAVQLKFGIQHLRKGYEEQLPSTMKAHGASQGCYVVVGANHERTKEALKEIKSRPKNKTIVYIDGTTQKTLF